MLSEVMSEAKEQRLRDPIHGLIVFKKDDFLDQLAWELINTSEFQRLRRIKQLGVSEFTFPGATHTRFAHSIGVFHVARELVEIIGREINKERTINAEDLYRADVAVIAALLHDIGHGPLSHTFEGVLELQGSAKDHEVRSAEIILNVDGNIKPCLDRFKGYGEKFATDIASLLGAENPKDIYHAVVSSSFDADRLDYLQRDRLTTGTGAGAIDFDWLKEHVRVTEIDIGAGDIENDPIKAPTVCLDEKARPAAEQFLLSRYTLFEQVYYHKATRCIECMIGALLSDVANYAKQDIALAAQKTGLDQKHPLLCFFAEGGDTLQNYLQLDDAMLFSAFGQMASAEDAKIRKLSQQLRNRDLYKALDIRKLTLDGEDQVNKARMIDNGISKGQFKGRVLKDAAKLGIYKHINNAEDEKQHKKLMILQNGKPVQISSISKVVEGIGEKTLTRYYFEEESDLEKVMAIGTAAGETHGA